jgi:hypothetical protein
LVGISELVLPREGFAQLAKAFLPGSRICILVADVGDAEIGQLLPHLPEWIPRVDPIRATHIDNDRVAAASR